jgi:hypothetical protein
VILLPNLWIAVRTPNATGGCFATARALSRCTDFAEEDADRRAEAVLADPETAAGTPLLAAALGAQGWLARGGAPPRCAPALVRHCRQHGLLISQCRSLAPPRCTRHEQNTCPAAFVHVLPTRPEYARQLLWELERAWLGPRGRVADRRRHCHAVAVVDLVAAMPLLSATALAALLGVAIKPRCARWRTSRRLTSSRTVGCARVPARRPHRLPQGHHASQAEQSAFRAMSDLVAPKNDNGD